MAGVVAVERVELTRLGLSQWHGVGKAGEAGRVAKAWVGMLWLSQASHNGVARRGGESEGGDSRAGTAGGGQF